jgi:hypothetical protein
MSHPLLRTLISEMVESYLEESYEDNIVESIFEEVSEETWEAIEEAILNELSPTTLKSYIKKADKEIGKRQGILKRGGRDPEKSEKQKSNYDKLQRRNLGLRIARSKIDDNPVSDKKSSKYNLTPSVRVKAK